MTYEIEIFLNDKWEPLYGTDTDGKSSDSVSPEDYVEKVSELTGHKLRVRPGLKEKNK